MLLVTDNVTNNLEGLAAFSSRGLIKPDVRFSQTWSRLGRLS